MLVQAQAARLLKMSERTFRRSVARYEAKGPAALRDRRLGCSARRAPPEAVEALYRASHRDWNVRHFYDEVCVAEGGGTRSYTWVKNRLQEAGLAKKGQRKGPHRERRERKPAAGQMLHARRCPDCRAPATTTARCATCEAAGLRCPCEAPSPGGKGT